MNHFHPSTHLYYHPRNDIYLNLGLLFCILVFAGETFRRMDLETSLEFWVIFSLLAIPSWLEQYRYCWDWFLWIKTISLLPVAVVWCSLVRIGTSASATRIGSFLVLSVNIFEAILKDLQPSGYKIWNPLNACSGILLVLSEMLTMGTIRISTDGMSDFLWTHGQNWIIAYTIWNFTLVYGNYPYAIGRHTFVLLAPLVLLIHNSNGWDNWLQARGYTLAFYFVIRGMFYQALRKMTDVSFEKSVHQTRMLQLCSFASIVILLVVNHMGAIVSLLSSTTARKLLPETIDYMNNASFTCLQDTPSTGIIA